MATEPVAGGYLDRQALARAIQANAAVRQIIGDLLRGGSQLQQLQLLLQLTYEMSEQNHALHEMRRIRQRPAGNQTPAESTEDTE